MEDIIKGRFTMSSGADVINGISGLLYARIHCIVFHIDL